MSFGLLAAVLILATMVSALRAESIVASSAASIVASHSATHVLAYFVPAASAATLASAVFVAPTAPADSTVAPPPSLASHSTVVVLVTSVASIGCAAALSAALGSIPDVPSPLPLTDSIEDSVTVASIDLDVALPDALADFLGTPSLTDAAAAFLPVVALHRLLGSWLASAPVVHNYTDTFVVKIHLAHCHAA